MKPFSEALLQFFRKRDEAVRGLVRLPEVLYPTRLEQAGYRYIDGATHQEGEDEYEFSVYEKGDHRVVFIQVYEEREGGLHHQTVYTSFDHDQVNTFV